MEMISDILLVAGAIGAGVYCFVLARRLNHFNDLETGMGGAVAVLSAQVDDLTRTLQAARQTADGSTRSLVSVTERAEDVARRLELLVAAMHDLPNHEGSPPPHRQAPVSPPTAEPGPVFKRHHEPARGAAQ